MSASEEVTVQQIKSTHSAFANTCMRDCMQTLIMHTCFAIYRCDFWGTQGNSHRQHCKHTWGCGSIPGCAVPGQALGGEQTGRSVFGSGDVHCPRVKLMLYVFLTASVRMCACVLGLHNGCKFTACALACAHINASLPLPLRPQGMPSCRRSSGRFQQRGPSWFCCCASPLSFRSLCSTTPLVSLDSCCVEANLLDSYLLPFT